MPGQDPCLALRRLLDTMHALRSPEGCPWDAEQTPESLAPYILEEACEAIEAIENDSPALIADELGDLLLQIVFQAAIFAERGLFDFADVADGIDAKLRRRHPHVFSCSHPLEPTEDLDRQWERIKREEQAGCSRQMLHPLGTLPESLPALQRAQKLVGRLHRRGLSASQLPALPRQAEKTSEDHLGAALLQLAQQAEFSGLDAEQVLRRTIRKIMTETATKPPENEGAQIRETQ